jgi:hypothetical protein
MFLNYKFFFFVFLKDIYPDDNNDSENITLDRIRIQINVSIFLFFLALS